MNVIITSVALLGAALPQGDKVHPPQFDPPIRLLADGEPLGIKTLYPSPRLYDIDRDGVDELVIGDLFGRIRYAEKAGETPEAWGRLEPFVTDKRPLKFHNW